MRADILIRPSCLWGQIYGSTNTNKLREVCKDLTVVTLADEDTNSIQTDDAIRAIQSNVAMHVTPQGGQIMQFQIDFSWKND